MAKRKLVCMGVVLEQHQIEKLNKLAKRHRASKGCVIRAAINALWNKAESKSEEICIDKARIQRGKNE